MFLLSTGTASAIYFTIYIDKGAYNKANDACFGLISICRVVIDYGWGDNPNDRFGISHDTFVKGDVTYDAASGRVIFILAEPLSDDLKDGKSRTKFTLHEDTVLDQRITDELGLSGNELILKKGTYSFGGRTSTKAAIKSVLNVIR